MKIVNKETPRTYLKDQYFCNKFKHFTLPLKPFSVTHSIPVFQREGTKCVTPIPKEKNITFSLTRLVKLRKHSSKLTFKFF